MRRIAALPVIAVAAALALAGCDGSASGEAKPRLSTSPSPTPAPPPSKTTRVGVTVTGEFGTKPTLTIPKIAAPTTTSVEVLTPGTGDPVEKGDVLVADYLGQTWADKDGKPNVFNNTYDANERVGVAIGAGMVIKGWDSTLIGQHIGSRVLLTIAPADGEGAQSTADNDLGGQTLIFVVDLRSRIKGDGVARGELQPLPAGFPAVKSASGKRPKVTAVKGVSAPPGGMSALLVKGTGEWLDDSKQLVVHFLQTDTSTGTRTQNTWNPLQPQVTDASTLLEILPVFKGQRVGSRAVAVTPALGGVAQVVVVDVIGQF